MKYMLLIYHAEDAFTPDQYQACLNESIKLCHDLHAKGQYISASPLHPVSTATTVKVRDGKSLITDGPFAETREQLGGYYMVDVANLDEALAVAARIPGGRFGGVEVRPVVHLDTLPK